MLLVLAAFHGWNSFKYRFPLAFNAFLHAEKPTQAHCCRNTKGAGNVGAFLRPLGIKILCITVKDISQQDFVSLVALIRRKKSGDLKMSRWVYKEENNRLCSLPLWQEIIPSWWCFHNIPPLLPPGQVAQQRASHGHEQRQVQVHEFSRRSTCSSKRGRVLQNKKISTGKRSQLNQHSWLVPAHSQHGQGKLQVMPCTGKELSLSTGVHSDGPQHTYQIVLFWQIYHFVE